MELEGRYTHVHLTCWVPWLLCHWCHLGDVQFQHFRLENRFHLLGCVPLVHPLVGKELVDARDWVWFHWSHHLLMVAGARRWTTLLCSLYRVRNQTVADLTDA